MMRELLKGAVCGSVATAAMSGVMVAGSRMGLMRDQPPKRIARAALPGRKHDPKPGEGVAGALAHLGFGATAGALYGVLARGHRAPAAAGVGYALAIWASSYQGWIPGLGILPPASDDRPGRQVVMVAGHVVYGTVLALTMNRLNMPAGPATERESAAR
ncbi:hypothetical protein E1267_32445 [Nonomuraea longispora]|uniref:DUF1440 domain-containing protein n=1 Tax=Nonomuraea longispora TaxID=1848320 RepID=A0A4R4MY70_9ACTN|nr:DUF6789 family protein [Nonomuraea longispora]TDC01259.1 hypothetical protein E1267_32445 [Nonomuraea longispora]